MKLCILIKIKNFRQSEETYLFKKKFSIDEVTDVITMEGI